MTFRCKSILIGAGCTAIQDTLKLICTESWWNFFRRYLVTGWNILNWMNTDFSKQWINLRGTVKKKILIKRRSQQSDIWFGCFKFAAQNLGCRRVMHNYFRRYMDLWYGHIYQLLFCSVLHFTYWLTLHAQY